MTGENPALFTRRAALTLGVAGMIGLALSACGQSDDSATGAATPSSLNPDCVLTPEEIEGPFYTDLNLLRRDLTDAKPGSPLQMELTVIDAANCEPIQGATVDISHADAWGLYSALVGQGRQ